LQLLKSDLLRAVTLAVQSLDVTTLKSIKRRNIPFNSFSELVQEFRKENIETYTELIIGLPGETLASYKQSLNELMELEIRPMVYVYNCGVFENAPMNNAKYKSKYEIQTIRSPIYL
jgi:radical SAM superfamily enzyme